MTSAEIRKKFLEFFASKGHTIVPSSSLLPDDPSVLFTTAGMQQFKKYYTGEADPMKDFHSLNTVSIQKSIRTSDIDEVGDDTHDTFFEMLGNFSFGGYWKEEAIRYAHEFITKEMGLSLSYVTVFEGSAAVPKDEESKKIWQLLGVQDIREEGMKDVFWGPTGNSGPCGPTTEIYLKNKKGQDVEVWNVVFNEFFCDGSREQLLAGEAKLIPLAKKGIDTGMGLERLAMASQNTENIFATDLFAPLMRPLPETLDMGTRRIIADHLRASTFLLAEGVIPSNKEQGYVLRRLLRRVLTTEHRLHFSPQILEDVILSVIQEYGRDYPELVEKKNDIINQYFGESGKFKNTLGKGLKELERLTAIDAGEAFKIYASYGLPYEVVKDVAGEKATGFTRADFDAKFKEHQEKSRAGAEKKFGGHGLLLDTGELKAANEEELKKVTRLHTATHILQAALRNVLGLDVKQMGSDITTERLRFDFTFPRKMTPEEIKQTEKIINAAVSRAFPVSFREMPYEEAMKLGVLAFFKEKYPALVKVYTIGEEGKEAFSRELCGGPHVRNTSEVGEIKIAKEEAVGAGVRRIRAVVK
ncbi:MAG: alanine--tRNA ligase [Patescibacteria group bacterium]